ncbi:PD40 domain-containing protein, partial [bacterium]|nr:PD40 domain-containing protein [bacterium]
TSNIHERNSKWSPDGRWIAYISDASGEDEIYIIPQDGSAPAQQLTSNAETYKYQLYWSPDSKKIMWADKRLRLRYVDIETKVTKDVIQAEAWEIEYGNYAWSPDSRWIAYSKYEVEGMKRVYLYSMDKDESFAVTDGWYSSSDPVFSSDGKYLFFVSDRDFAPIYSRTEWNHAYQDMARIYLTALSREVESPFKPKSDEVEIKKEKPKKEKNEKSKKEAVLPVKVDTDGLNDRIIALPVQISQYKHLTSSGSKLYYMRKGSKDSKSHLLLYDLTEQKETDLGEIAGYEISADLKKMLVSQNGKYAIIDIPKSKITLKETLNLSGMEMKIDRYKEWKQIYLECWRQMRDFFYDPNMHKVNWQE